MKLNIAVLTAGAALAAAVASAQSLPNLFPLPNGSGLLETYNINNASISS